MKTAIDLIEALVMFGGAMWGLLYYTGHLKYSGEKEKRRKERVKKYGWLLLLGVFLMLMGSLGLFIMTVT